MTKRTPHRPSRPAPDLEAARAWFRAHRADAVPDAGFAARVSARLERRPADLLGPAALRLLPAALALTALLGAFALVRGLDRSAPAGDVAAMDVEAATSTATEAELLAPTEDLLAWVLEEPE